jgi:hypothetical protein
MGACRIDGTISRTPRNRAKSSKIPVAFKRPWPRSSSMSGFFLVRRLTQRCGEASKALPAGSNEVVIERLCLSRANSVPRARHGRTLDIGGRVADAARSATG